MNAAIIPLRARTVAVTGHVRRAPAKTPAYYSLHERMAHEVAVERAMAEWEAEFSALSDFPPVLFADPEVA